LSDETTTAQDEATAERIIELLDRGDKILAQIAPYEADTFTHIEARYYNLKLDHLAQAKKLWAYSEKRWGKIVDYGTDVDITRALIIQTKCE